jgi:hypothetical protein
VRGFRPVRAIVRELIYGPEPVGHAGAAKLQTYSAGQLNGSRLGGLPHVNMRGEASVTFLGLIASPQQFVGNAQMGANRHATVQETPALPNSTQPEAAPTWFRDWSSTEAVLS